MTLQLEVLGPCLVLLVGAAIALVRPAGVLFVAAEAASLALLLRLWQLSSVGSLVLPLYEPLPGIQLALRVDHVGLFFAVVALAAGLLISAPWLLRPARRHRLHLGWVLLAQAGMISVVLAGSLETLAAGWTMTAGALSLLVLVSRVDRSGHLLAGTSVLWHTTVQSAGAVLLLAGTVTVEVIAGTGGFDAVPVGAIDTRAYLLIAAAPVIALLGLGVTARALREPLGASLAIASVSVPMACYLLVRLYDISDGRLPDPSLGTGMMVIGGVAATWLAVSSLWAADLGAALTRLVQAAAALLLVAAGAGSGLGIAAVAIGTISVSLGASLAYAVIDAGRGRLPSFTSGAPVVPATATSMAVILALAWCGGIGGGLASATRIATIQAGLTPGVPVGLAAVPAVAGTLAMLYAAYGAGRFGGGARPTATDALRLVSLGVALPVTSILAVPMVYPIVVPIAAGTLRITPAEVSNALQTSPSGSVIVLVVFGLLLVAAAVLARPGGPLDSAAGLPRAPGFLPPPMTVLPRVTAARGARKLARVAHLGVDVARRHPLVATAVAVAAALATLNSALR